MSADLHACRICGSEKLLRKQRDATAGFLCARCDFQPALSFKHVPGAETVAYDPPNASLIFQSENKPCQHEKVSLMYKNVMWTCDACHHGFEPLNRSRSTSSLKDAPRDGTEILLLVEMDQRLGGGKHWHVMHWVDDSSPGGKYGNWTDYWNDFAVSDPWDKRQVSYTYKNTPIGWRTVPDPETTCQPSEHTAPDMLEKRARANILAQASREAEVTQKHGQFAQSSQMLEDVRPKTNNASASNDSGGANNSPYMGVIGDDALLAALQRTSDQLGAGFTRTRDIGLFHAQNEVLTFLDKAREARL